MTKLRAMAFALAVLLAAGFVRAKEAAARADALFSEARALMKHGDYAAACPKLAESQRLDPAPGTLINLADCSRKLGKPSEALNALREAMKLLAPNDDRRVRVQEEMDELEAELAPKDNGEDQPRPAEKQSVKAQQTARADVVEPRPPSTSGSSLSTAGYVLGSVGVLGIAIGTVSFIQFRSKESEREDVCPSQVNCSADEIAKDERLKDEANEAGVRAGLGLGLGALALAGGITLVVLGDQSDPQSGFRASAVVVGGGYGLQIRGAW